MSREFLKLVFSRGLMVTVGWKDTRNWGSVDDVGDCGKKNIKVLIQHICGNGIISHDLGAVF